PLQLGHEIADLPDLLPDSGTARRQMIEPPDTFARLRQPAVELFEWVHTSPTNERPGRVPHPRRTVGGHSTNTVTIPGVLGRDPRLIRPGLIAPLAHSPTPCPGHPLTPSARPSTKGLAVARTLFLGASRAAPGG